MENDAIPEKKMSRPKLVAGIGGVIIISGVILEFLSGWGIVSLGVTPGSIIGLTVLVGALLICCTSTLMLTGFAAKIPGYGDMEIKFEEAKHQFDNQETELALSLFKELMGPEMNHKRALYYAAKCCEVLDDYEQVKHYCTKYIRMQPRDAEVWEMLANAHKKLFEYEESEDAMIRAENLK